MPDQQAADRARGEAYIRNDCHAGEQRCFAKCVEDARTLLNAQHYARVLDKNIMEDMQGVAKLIFK